MVSILLLLQAQGQMTAKQLAESLEVSERTINRDMEALSSAGIPVLAERGKSGGWKLLDGYQTKLTGLKESEIQSLFVSLPAPLLHDLGLTQTYKDANGKLLAALPVGLRESAKSVWNRIHIDMSTWRQQQEKIAVFETLKTAVWQDHKLQIEYKRMDGKINTYLVQPLGLVAKGSKWYFIASKENEELRSYRASRIRSAVPCEETFERPKDFDLAQYWSRATKAFVESLPSFEVQVEVTAKMLPRLTFENRVVPLIEMENNNKDWIPVKLSFHTEDEAKSYILGFANQIKVIEPKEMQEQILKMAEATVAFYKAGKDNIEKQ
jgi:predicted DNA-binding transcriptional regulator YafY